VYQSYYNLTGKPFRLSPDPEFFFPSRGHKRALAYLRYGLNQSEGFVVITGAPGTGKTTLAQILLKEMGEKNVVVAHLTTTQLDADDMLRMVAASFGLRYEKLDKAALLKTIESFLLARSREQKRALLVIDEAQNLPARSLEELRMLSNLQVGDKALLQTFLLGQAQFRQMLDHPDLEQLRQRVIANYHLSPLAADEGQRYIESRLKLVSWDNDPHFAELAFELIHEYTEGVPRRINMLCDRILLYGCMEEKHEVTSELVRLVIQELEQEISGTPLKPETFDVLSAQPQPPVMTPVNKAPVAEKSTAKKDVPVAPVSVPTNNATNNATKSDPMPAIESEVDSVKPDSATVLAATNQLVKNLKNITRPEPVSVESAPKEPVPKERVVPQSHPEDIPQKSISQAEGSLLYPGLNGKVAEEDELFIEITEDFHDMSDDETGEGDEVRRHVMSNAVDSQESPSRKYTEDAGVVNQVDAVSAKSSGSNGADDSPSTGESKDKESPIKFDLKSEKNQQKVEDSEQIMGNTVKHKQPEPDKLDVSEEPEDAPPAAVGGAAQFSERELFRVIPGGKNDSARQVSESGQAEVMAPAAHATPSSEDVVLRRILRLVLAFHRSPSSFPGLDDPTQPLPEGVSELLELAVADDQVLTKVSPAAVMGISPVMLRAAVRFFVRRTLFVADDSDHYRILGLPPVASLKRIERHYDLLMRLLRQDKQPGASECVAKVGQAYEALTRNEDFTVVERDAVIPQPEDKTEAVLQALENPELTIDFSEEIKPEKPAPHVSAYFGQESQAYTPDPRVTRRRIHLLGQAAILGIGALVIVLGLFITQLEPTEPDVIKQPTDITAQDETSFTRPGVSSTDIPTGQTQVQKLPQSDLASSDVRENKNEIQLAQQNTDSVDVGADGVETIGKTQRKSSNRDTLYVTESATEFVAPVVKSTAKARSVSPKTAPAIDEASGSSLAASEVMEESISVPVSTFDSANNSTSDPVPSSTQLSTSRFKPVPVQARLPVSTATPSTDRESSSALPQSTVNTESTLLSVDVEQPANKFVAVPIASKAKALSSNPRPGATISSTSQAGAESGIPNNQFEGRDIPLQERVDSLPVKQQGFVSVPSNSTLLDSEPADNGSVTAEVFPIDEVPVDDVGAAENQASAVAASSVYVAISQQALNELLTQFTEAYQAGDVTRVMSLFAAKARTNEHATRSGIESDHRALFASTTSRQMAISGLSWENEGNFARGVGQYKATIISKNNPAASVFRGKLTLQAQRGQNNDLKITRFYFSNQIVSAEGKAVPAAPAIPVTRAAPPVTRSAPAPVELSQAELNSLLSNFSRHYEAGDTNNLMKLFASNARTNDRSTLAGIRQDHIELFNASVMRKMFLKNTKWKTTGKFASGTGSFEVMIQNKGQANFNSVNGSFAIEAEKTPNGVQITKFIHKIQ